MPVSFGMLGILLMLDICFIVNYFFVRALRKWTNRRMRQEDARARATAAERVEEERKTSSDIVSNNLQGVVEMMNDAFRMNQEFAFAWALGTVKLDPLRVKTFPGWKPIPLNFGLCSTCVLVFLATVLLSPDLLTNQLGVSVTTLDGDLCVSDVYATGVEDLRKEILDMTHLDLARKQFSSVMSLHNAIVNDTTLYGVPPYDCPNRGMVSGLKSNWAESTPFFPGYCEKAQEAAIHAAKNRECVQEICDCPTLPDSALFKTTGLAGRKYCGEVCIEAPYPCPKHSADVEEELEDYRFHQFQFAEDRRMNSTNTFPTTLPDNIVSPATATAEKILFQVDVASYLYIAYQCLSLFFPSPLILFRMPLWSGFKRLLFGVQKPYFICVVVAVWWGIEYFRAVWYSPDVRLFVNNLRVGDPCFMDAGYLLERQGVLNEVCEELMPMAPDFQASAWTISDVLREASFFDKSCDCKFPTEHISQLIQPWITNASLIGFNMSINLCSGDSEGPCTLYFPHENVEFFGNSTICTNGTAARRLVFESAPDNEIDWWDLWVASGFLAMIVVKFAVANYGISLMTLADPFIVCAGEFLWVPTDMGMEIKADNGQTERVQFLEAFDERGRALPTDMIAKWFDSKRRALYHVGMSKTFFWGVLMHLCMFNLFAALREELDEEMSIVQILQERDTRVLASCVGFAAFVFCVGVCGICKLSGLAPEGEGGETSDDSFDEDNPNRRQTAHLGMPVAQTGLHPIGSGPDMTHNQPGMMVIQPGQIVANPMPAVAGLPHPNNSQLLHGTVVQVNTYDDSRAKFFR